jgi:signal transduction histidine kinase
MFADFSAGGDLMDASKVLATERLYEPTERRFSLDAENRALHALARQMTRAPEAMLLRLVHVAAELCVAETAVACVLVDTPEGSCLRWEAVVGPLDAHRGRIFPRTGDPSALALDRNSPQLFVHPEQSFPSVAALGLPCHELLVVPLYADSRPVGTLWVASHGLGRAFDKEDVRLLQGLADFTCAAWDVTATRQALARVNEELREAQRKKDTFFATLSHELRSPLGALANAIDLIRTGVQSEWALEVVRRQTEQLGHLLDDVQDVTCVTQGKMKLRARVTTAQEAVEGAVLTVAHAVEDRRHTLTVSVPDQPVWLMADPPRLTQILVNLLANAARYTETGGLIRIAVEAQDGWVTFRVTDTGQGIPPALIPRIFELYEQGETGSRMGGGLGIGLSLVRGLVQLHEGTVEVCTGPNGVGSEFTVRLPQGRIVEALAPVQTEARQPKMPAPWRLVPST